MDYESVKYVEGFIENIIFRNEDNGYTVFEIEYKGEDITCVGTLSSVDTGEFIAAEGEFVKRPSYYTMQFKVTSYEFKTPTDAESVKRYLSSGAIKGIGAKMAERIVKEFGEQTFDILDKEPERLAEIKGISYNKAMDIAQQYAGKRDTRKAVMYLQDYGIQMNLANKIFRKYGNSIYTIIKDNPYKLADDIDGIGFKKADAIATKVGIKGDSDFRIKSGMLYCLNQAALQGHTYLPYDELKRQSELILDVNISDFEHYISDLAIDKKLVIKKTSADALLDNGQEQSDTDWNVYSTMYYRMEQNVAKNLLELNIQCDENVENVYERIADIEKAEKIELDDIQKKAIVDAALNGLMVITGGPGTGKTTTINAIIKYFEMEGLDIRLAAPTGRAAKRMTETCGVEAQTIHRLLEIAGGGLAELENEKRSAASGIGLHFNRDQENPLETDVIIVDEMSMVDINIMNALLKAVPVGTRLILVGDVDQLPSVGPGNVLKDIIASECFNVVKLEKIFRQAAESEIITNAHRINKGEKVTLNKYSRDFLFIHRNGPEAIIAALKTVIKDKLPGYVNADVSEIQVLTPSRRSSVGVERLNMVLQDYLNPSNASKMEKKHGDTLFREGDKVMQIKNDYQLEWEKKNNYGIVVEQGSGVFNGDTGVVKEIVPFNKSMTVRFEDGRYVEYSYENLDELELAYAITVHKAQGSEYPAVIIPMYTGPRMLMNRNILYTAITRARKCVCIIGEEEVFAQMINNESDAKRYTSLDERIRDISNGI